MSKLVLSHLMVHLISQFIAKDNPNGKFERKFCLLTYKSLEEILCQTCFCKPLAKNSIISQVITNVQIFKVVDMLK